MIDDAKPYPTYKDSGQPWLAELPEHWDVIRGKGLFTKAKRPVRDGDETVTCFRDGEVTLRKNRRTTGFTEAIAEHGYQGVRKGDLVIHAMDAFAGAAGISDSDGKASPICGIGIPQGDVFAPYFAFVVREMARRQWILALSKGIRERSTDFRFETFGELPLPVPPPAEQAGIVRVLAALDRRVNRLVRAKRRLLGLLAEQKQAVITHAITRGLDPHAPTKPSGVPWLGDVPEHWEVRRIKSLSQVKRGASPRPIAETRWFDEGGDYGWVRIVDVTRSKKYLRTTDQRLSKDGVERSVPLEPGRLILSIAGSVGKPILTAMRCCIHDGFVHFPQLSDNSEFLYYVFLSQGIFDGLGKIGTQLNLNTETVGSICIPWPDEGDRQSIVEEIEERIRDLDAAADLARREIDLIREYRTRLVADVVTGKLDVRAVAATLPSEDEADDAEPEDVGLEEDADDIADGDAAMQED